MKFSMSEAWRDATAMMSANREVLLVVAGLFFFLPSVVLNLAMGDAQNVASANPEAAQELVAASYAQWWWLMILIGIVSIVGSLALLALLRDHNRPTVGEAIKTGLVGLLPALGTYLIMAVGALLIIFLTSAILGSVLGVDTASPTLEELTLIGSVAFLIMIYPAVKLSLSAPVIAIDKLANPFKVLARSWRLTKSNSLRLFLFYFLLGIVYVVLMLVIGMIMAVLLLIAGQGAWVIINALISSALSAGASVVFVAVIAAAHRQLAGPSAAAVSATFE
jgi:hypothetical protein